MAESTLGHHDLARTADRVDERLRDRAAHELVIRCQETVHAALLERHDQRVHVDDGDAGIHHLVDRIGQGADAEGLDGDEVPFLRGHVVDGGALLGSAEFAVEPGDLDVEELAPEFRGLLALGAPGRLQSGVREGRLQRLLGPSHLGGGGGADQRIEAEAAEDGRRARRSADLANEVSPRCRRQA